MTGPVVTEYGMWDIDPDDIRNPTLRVKYVPVCPVCHKPADTLIHDPYLREIMCEDCQGSAWQMIELRSDEQRGH